MKKLYVILYIILFVPFISQSSQDVKDVGEKKGLAEKAKPKIPEHIKVAIAKNNEDEILKFIKEFGPFIEAVDEQGNTLLHLAVMANAITSVRALLYAGINETVLNNDGLAALHIAVKKKLPRIVSLLIEHGADVSIKDKQGKTPLDYETTSEIKKMLEDAQKSQLIFVTALKQMGAFKEGQIINVPDFIKKGYVSDFRRFINLIPGALQAFDDKGNTLLHYAIISESANVVRLLLARGANIDAPDKNWKRTPLLLVLAREYPPAERAEYGFDIAIINLFLDFGANVNVQDSSEKTPLHYAVKKIF